MKCPPVDRSGLRCVQGAHKYPQPWSHFMYFTNSSRLILSF